MQQKGAQGPISRGSAEPTVNGLTRAQLEAQLASAIERRCWWAEDAIRADLRELDLGGGR